MGSLPTDQTLDDVIVRIKRSYTNPNVKSIAHTVLKEGPRAYRIATLTELIDSATGKFHHYRLKIDQIDRKKSIWTFNAEKSVGLNGEDPDEIERLYRFLSASRSEQFRDESGELHVIRGEEFAKLDELLEAVPKLADNDKLQPRAGNRRQGSFRRRADCPAQPKCAPAQNRSDHFRPACPHRRARHVDVRSA